MKKKTARSLKRDTISIGINNIVVNIVAVVTSILIARALGPKGQGLIALLFLVIDFVTRFMGFGIQGAAQFFINSKEDKTINVIRIVFTIMLALSLLIGTIIILFYRPKDANFSLFGLSGPFLASLFIAIYIITNFVRVNLIGLFNALEHFSKANTFNLINICIPALLFVVAFFQGKLSIELVLVGYILTSVIGLCLVIKSFNSIGYSIGWFFDYNLFKRMIKYGAPIFYNSIAMFLQQRLNAFFVGNFFGLAPLGYFSVAYGVSDRLTDVSSPLVTTHLPKVTKMKNASKEEAVLFTIHIFRMLFALYLIVLLPFIVATYYLLPILYSEAYVPSVIPAIILTIGTIAWGLSRILFNLYASLKMQITSSIILTIGVVINIIGLIVIKLTKGDILDVSVLLSVSIIGILLITVLLACRNFNLRINNFTPNFTGLMKIILNRGSDE